MERAVEGQGSLEQGALAAAHVGERTVDVAHVGAADGRRAVALEEREAGVEAGGVVAVVVARPHPDHDLIARLARDRPDVDLARRHRVLHLAGDRDVREVRLEVKRGHRLGGSRVQRGADLIDERTLERTADAGDEVREVADVRRVEGEAPGVQRGEVQTLRLRAAELVRREVLARQGDVRLLVQLVRVDLCRLLVADRLRLIHAGAERRVRGWVVGIAAAGLRHRVAGRAEHSLLALDLTVGDALCAFERGPDHPRREEGALARDPPRAPFGPPRHAAIGPNPSEVGHLERAARARPAAGRRRPRTNPARRERTNVRAVPAPASPEAAGLRPRAATRMEWAGLLNRELQAHGHGFGSQEPGPMSSPPAAAQSPAD